MAANDVKCNPSFSPFAGVSESQFVFNVILCVLAAMSTLAFLGLV